MFKVWASNVGPCPLFPLPRWGSKYEGWFEVRPPLLVCCPQSVNKLSGVGAQTTGPWLGHQGPSPRTQGPGPACSRPFIKNVFLKSTDFFTALRMVTIGYQQVQDWCSHRQPHVAAMQSSLDRKRFFHEGGATKGTQHGGSIMDHSLELSHLTRFSHV